MEYKVCYYCDTKYPADEERCPLCGGRETKAEEVDETPAELRPETPAPAPARREKQKRRGLGVVSTIVCVLLALAVIAGTLFILQSLGVIGGEKPVVDDSSLTLPVETETERAVACLGLTLSPKELTFTEADQRNAITVTTDPADCTEPVLFESGDPAIASVSEDGQVTAVSPGTTSVTVTCGEFAKSVPVRCDFIPSVDPEDVTGEPPAETGTETEQNPPETGDGTLAISSEDFTLFYAGETTKLTISGGGAGDVQWSTTDPSVATVKDGTVTAVAPGTATITATVGGKSVKAVARCRFEASSAAPEATPTGDVTISQEDVTLFSKGETFTLRMLDGDQRVSGVTWTTSDASVCSVDGGGVVTAMGSGTARISGVYGGVTKVCIVRCGF